jgi:hypothetical protein
LLTCAFAGQRDPKCRVPSTLVGSCPRASMTSISPEHGQPPYLSFWGSIHKAGQTPLPVGNLARNSNRPYFWLNSGLPSLFRVLPPDPLPDPYHPTPPHPGC